jgi:hypothetical protein
MVVRNAAAAAPMEGAAGLVHNGTVQTRLPSAVHRDRSSAGSYGASEMGGTDRDFGSGLRLSLGC